MSGIGEWRRADSPTPANTAVAALFSDLSDPFASQSQSTSVYVALGLSLGLMVFTFILFSLCRPHHKAIYAPKVKHADKRHAPPEIGNGIFAWVDPIRRTKEMDMVDKIGMDGALFLRFARMLRSIFIVLTVFGCAILIPVHIAFTQSFGAATSKRDGDSSQTDATVYLFKFTPRSVFPKKDQVNPMWAHVVFAYCSDIVIFYFLWVNYKAVARLRKAYFETPEYQNSVHGRSVMVTDITSRDRTDQGVLKLVDSVTQVESIPKTAIGRNMKELPELLEDHEEAVRKLEVVLAKYLKDPEKLPPTRPMMRAPGKAKGKIDKIDYLTHRIQDLEMRIKDMRETIDKRNPEPYGFATYETISDAHQVAWASRGKHPQGSTIELSPSPKDIIWKNLRLMKKTRAGKRFTANLWVILLTGLYIVPNAFIAIFLANLSNLAAVWPAFNTTFKRDNTLWAVVQAVLSPALFSLFYLFLPSIFRRISEQAGDQTKTSRERHVIHKLYAFFVFNNLIVFSIFSAVWSFVTAIITQKDKFTGNAWEDIQNEGQELANTLLQSLCNLSPFWVTWLLQRNVGAAIDLAQLVNMVFQWWQRHVLASTPRELIEATAPQPFDYASYYNYYLYYATVATCFSTIQPIVLPITLLFFVLEPWLKKYLLLYVFITKTESGGMYWNVLHNRMIFATLLQNVVGAIIVKACWGSWVMIACMAPLPFLILGFKIWTAKLYANQTRYYTRAIMKNQADVEAMEDAKKKIRHVSSRLTNPVMNKPLMTPMVHSKAQHMLAQIYAGRLHDDEPSNGFGVPMAPMDAGRPGQKAAGGLGNMFEVVNEADLDFANFKHRAEFKDQFGGGGELYGRPADIPDRSGTPATFVTSDAGSDGGPTRVGTPEPMPKFKYAEFQGAGGQNPYSRPGSRGYGLPPSAHERGDSFGSDAGLQRPTFGRDISTASSAHGLVRAAQPMGYTPVSNDRETPGEEFTESQVLGLNRWRVGGSGYTPVQQGNEFGDTDYETYRR